MNDMSSTIVAKSDQINAADLVGSSRTVTIRDVKIKPGDDQPVSILIEGDAKAFRPCKGVRRLLVSVWGPDASKYVGESMTLFNDPKVTWAGKEEGGIRVSHMTGLDADITFSMRISRAATKPYKIRPLKAEQQRQEPAEDAARNWTNTFIATVKKTPVSDALEALIKRYTDKLDGLRDNRPELHIECEHAIATAREGFAIDGQEKRSDEQHGEQFNDADPA
jgi:hypothetical protein